jgi:cysteine synthase
MGSGAFLREHCPSIRMHPLEPANSPTLSTGCKVGRHPIQGISDKFIPAICRLGELDSVIAVDDGDAIRMVQRLSAELGLPVGISSGANLLSALLAAEPLGDDRWWRRSSRRQQEVPVDRPDAPRAGAAGPPHRPGRAARIPRAAARRALRGREKQPLRRAMHASA